MHHAPPPARSNPHAPDRAAAVRVARSVMGARWRVFVCIAGIESRWELAPPASGYFGPWQISVEAHPWADPWLLTHSWLYSARAAWRITEHGRYWAPFQPDAANCGA